MASPTPDLDLYRADVERFLNGPGLAADREYAHLFTAEAVEAMAAASRGAPTRMRSLARFAAEGHLRVASADEMAEVEALFHAPLVAAPAAGAVSLMAVDPLIAAEPDGARRRELQTARLRAIDAHLGRLLADAGARRADAARALGATSAAMLVAEAARLDLGAIAHAAERLLATTDDIAARSLDRAAHAALGVPASALDSADLPRLIRAPHLEEDLPIGGVASAVARTREALGARSRASERSRFEGVAGAAEMLRVAGAALARGGVSPRLPVEPRRLADPALVQAHAFLLEGLLADPAWLHRMIGVADPGPITVAAATMRLLAARSAAAGSMALYAGPDDDLMSRALGLAWPAGLRGERLGSLGPVDELRGRMLAAALRTHLRETFGERWFAEPHAAGLLRELWLEGGDLEAETLARELGAPGLDPDLLVAEALETLG